MKKKLSGGLKDLLTVQDSFLATSYDVKQGIALGAIFGVTGACCFGLPGAAIMGFSAPLALSLLNSPSLTSWKRFVKKRVPNATFQKEKSLTWKSSLVAGGIVFGGLALVQAKRLFDITPLQTLYDSWLQKTAGAHDTQVDELFISSVKESTQFIWGWSLYAYMAYQLSKSLSDGFVSYFSKDMKALASTIKPAFESPEKRLTNYKRLANTKDPYALYWLNRTFVELGKEKEGLAAILNYYFKDNLKPSLPFLSQNGRKKLIEYDLKRKPPLTSFLHSLLLPVDKLLIDYYANLAIDDAKEKNDVSTLSLLATYQSYINDKDVDATWKSVAHIVTQSDSLDEKILGEGNSGGASQMLFEGVEDDPLRWSIVTTVGDKKILQGKYDLGKAIFPETNNNSVFQTPQMITLQDEGEKSRLFRQQLWGVPLDEFSITNSTTSLENLYAMIIDGVRELQDIYEAQDVVEIPETSWEEKFLSTDNNFYDAKQIEQSLEWLLKNNPLASDYSIQELPIVDPFVRNIGVHKQEAGPLILPYWDIEPKTRAPRIYDYATLLLTAKPYLSQNDFSHARSHALNLYEREESFFTDTTLKAYAGAVTLRTLGLFKAWSNEKKQSGLVSSRKQLLSSALGEMSYLRNHGDISIQNFAESNITLLEHLHGNLGVLQERFSQ